MTIMSVNEFSHAVFSSATLWQVMTGYDWSVNFTAYSFRMQMNVCLFLHRLQEEIHQKEEAENNLSAFRAVSLLSIL